nr:hypothetical protein BaRGS_016756 [Batillaria attramentaria]
MKNYKIGVLGLSETRWLQTGQLRFSSGEQLLYSGHTEDGAPHTEGVALMLAPEAQRALIGWEPVNSRIITAKFITKKKDIKLNIIQCYAPTNDAEEEKKDDFYQQLQTVIDRGGAKDMTILMGDFNAKIGSDNTGYEDTMGTHGLGQMNENGERFADFCALNQLVIGGSIFPHKRIHKATWRSPDHVTENQIDHICISRKFRRSWRDVRVMRGADVSSDHHLLATALRLRLKRHTNANSTRTRYNVGLLRNTDTQAAFRISLSNRFQPLQDLIEDSEMDIETQWEHSKKLWHDTCEEVLGKRKTQHKEWISADTIQKLEVRKEKKTALNTSRTRRAKAKAQEEYTAADREVKRSTRKDKRDYIDNLASQAEEAARQGNLKDLYQVTKKLAGKFQQTDKPVKDKNGHPLTTTEEQLKRWAEHFRELLNRPIPETPPDIPPAETELPINCDKPSKAEIRKAIMTLRNGKAAGPDEIPAEAIKADTETAVNMLHSLFSKIWEKEEVPAQWKEGIVIKLPKKGDLRDCSNYRGIMLLSVPGKVLNRILLERMREAVDPMLRDQQAGFRRNRSCADQIASLRIIVEQSLEWNSPLYINFIDYEKAFDSVDREALWKLPRHYGVPGKIISLIQCTYQDMSCRIAHAGQLSESFEVKTGVRQGCLLSPFLFLLVIDWIMKTTTAGRKNGIQWTLWTQLDDLDFADDLALLSHSHSQMQDKTTCLEATSAGTGLKINRKKTELMKINTTANTPVTVGGEPIREVESFAYLGSVVDGQGGTDRDVTARIGKARAAMVMLKNVWASKVVSIRTKLRIFNSNVKSVLLYGCETWRTTKTMQQKIQTFLNTCLRRIFNIRWPEKIRNEELWERAGQEPVAKQILRRKWGWIGHTLRKPASSTTRQALTWNPQGKRKRGRPRNSWRRDTEAELYSKAFDWGPYLVTSVASAAPVSCFRHVPMNDSWDQITVGMKVEVINYDCDLSCSSYWIASVVKVAGYMGLLRYEGFGNDASHDFWFHECMENHKLKRGMRIEVVDKMCVSAMRVAIICQLVEYRNSCLSKIAMQKYSEDDVSPDMLPKVKDPPYRMTFQAGMKLEAIDPLNLSAICVATVMKVLRNNYLMIGIDGSPMAESGSDWFCYHSTSPCIFPVGFYYKGTFKWFDYLKQTKSVAAPVKLFDKEIPKHGFRPGMKIEAVDLMEPRLICVATVTRIVGRLLRVHFDGWDNEYDQWVDCQSPDIYPVGWCQVMNYNLEGPRIKENPAPIQFMQKKKKTKNQIYKGPRKKVKGIEFIFIIEYSVRAVGSCIWSYDSADVQRWPSCAGAIKWFQCRSGSCSHGNGLKLC